MEIKIEKAELTVTLTVNVRELQIIERALYNDEPSDRRESDENFTLWSAVNDVCAKHGVETLRVTE